MEIACPVCKKVGAAVFPYLDGGWPELELFSDLNIEVCQGCGFGQASPAPKSEQLTDFYQSRYREESSAYYIDFDGRKEVGGNLEMEFRSLSQLSLATMFCNFQSQDVLLDLGPGWGGSFQTAQQILEEPALVAIELNSGAELMYQRLFGAKSYRSTQEFIRSNGKLAKIAILSHSLEHYAARDVPALLNDLHRVVSIDGALVIEVPHDDFRSRSATLAFQTPHLCFFSPESLEMALSQAGWHVEFLKSCSHPLLPDSLKAQSPKEFQWSGISWRTKVRKQLPEQLVPLLRAVRSAKNEIVGTQSAHEGNPLNFVYGENRDCLRAVATHK
jgi:hypothetical protein